jgi:putative MFS transporter
MTTETTRKEVQPGKMIGIPVIVAALGYFVDIYDLLLFSIVRIKSLKDLGIADENLLSEGVRLLNMQMFGMLLGGIIWGVLGDKRGRVSVLFGSIFLYSVANILNGFVHDVNLYSWLRLVAGIGLAGELGAGITLVSEIMSKEARGYGTTIVATVGILGAVVAAYVGNIFDWRTAYFIGGGLGLTLLVLRIGLYESGMFTQLKEDKVSRGNFFFLFHTKERCLRYLNCILIGLPVWYVVGILVTFSPEFGKFFGMAEVPVAGEAVKYCYIGLSLGDLVSGFLSQRFRNRKKIIAAFLFLTALSIISYFVTAKGSLFLFYLNCGILGFSIGYWAVFVTIASENFGTNIRATVTTTAPNFIRGSVVPLTLAFNSTKGVYGLQNSAMAIGFLTLLIAALSLRGVQETFGKDLDYIEK